MAARGMMVVIDVMDVGGGVGIGDRRECMCTISDRLHKHGPDAWQGRLSHASALFVSCPDANGRNKEGLYECKPRNKETHA
jgi:hypothetical protein